MSSPFSKKFHDKSPISPLGKALVGKQNRLPQHLQDAIKAAPEMKDDSPLDKHGDKFRKEAMKLSEGVEQGDYDYENPEVSKLLDKAKKADKLHSTMKEAGKEKLKGLDVAPEKIVTQTTPNVVSKKKQQE